MRDPNRIDRILSLIKQLWYKHPDIRFNQLIHNLSWEYSRINNDVYKEVGYSKWEDERGIQFTKDMVFVDLFHLEDDKFEEFLIKKVEES
jgi:hypothetical protein